MARAREDFVFFATEIIGVNLYDYQKTILRDLSDPGVSRIAWHTAHGVGKTFTMACGVCAFLFTRVNSKVVTTASVNRQIKDILWPEVHRIVRQMRPNLYKIGWHWDFDLLDQSLSIDKDWFAIGANSDTPENMEGFHADHLLYIVDEAKTVEKSIFDAIEGAMTGKEEAKMMVVSTPPLAREGHFYEICSGKFKNWKIYHTSAEDSPNVSPDWIQDKKETWGENSPVYISKVKGEFPDASENTLIPTSWVEAANRRWAQREGVVPNEEAVIGCDPARYGDDETVIAVTRGTYVLPLEVHNKQDTMQTAGHVVRAIIRHSARQANIDLVGVGAGVYDRVCEEVKNQKLACSIKGISAGSKAPSLVIRGERLKFKRYRDYLYWEFREKLDPVNCPRYELIELPPDEKLKIQLTSIRYKILPDGSIEIESKDDLKKRGYNSPDRGEAVMFSTTKGYSGWTATINSNS